MLDGVPAAGLARRWGVPQCGLFRRLTSTLDAIHDLGSQGAPDGATVIAEEQTAGRGRDGRSWHSPRGCGLYFSILLALRERLPAVQRVALLDRLVPALARVGAGIALSEPERAAFAARDWLRGRRIRAPVPGRAGGLRQDGALLVDLGAGTVSVREGHVELA